MNEVDTLLDAAAWAVSQARKVRDTRNRKAIPYIKSRLAFERRQLDKLIGENGQAVSDSDSADWWKK